ncbi:MAG: cytochrome c3 family protein [Gemmatimonadota bacterium]|nr:cytochrome c3 family protein [Gemmatimonadota bacterium]
MTHCDSDHPIRGSRKRRPSHLLVLGLAALLLGAVACEDTEIIEVERPFFPDPPAQAGGALGYDEQDEKLTVCGNCHIGTQNTWEETAHADAWNTLQESGHAQEFCEGCHTVNERGNDSEAVLGYAATQDPRYHDVQCESCHGPGETHVSNPDASQPLASIAVDLGGPGGSLIPSQDPSDGCAECHSGAHHPFVDEWAQSPHAEAVAYPAGRAGCADCHRGQATLIAWGENADYKEKDSSEHLGQVCAVCHDPHARNNEGQLRFSVETVDLESNLCAQCHNRRTEPNPESSHGLEPHAPEAALLVGDAGYFFPGTNIGQGEIRGTHGTERNDRSCAACHVNMQEITDQATGEFVFNSTGHLFRPIPCVDAEGIPQPFGVQCELTPAERSFDGCVSGACHGSEQVASSVLRTAVLDVQRLVDELTDLLEQVDPGLDDAGGEIDANNPTFTVAEGAFFNRALTLHGDEDFGTNTVVGSTVHNPFLIRALLIQSIQAVEEEYGVRASLAADWDVELQKVLLNVPGR